MTMAAQNDEVLLAITADDLSDILGCSESALEAMRGMGVLDPCTELWNVGTARSYLRDAAWADQLWQ